MKLQKCQPKIISYDFKYNHIYFVKYTLHKRFNIYLFQVNHFSTFLKELLILETDHYSFENNWRILLGCEIYLITNNI